MTVLPSPYATRLDGFLRKNVGPNQFVDKMSDCITEHVEVSVGADVVRKVVVGLNKMSLGVLLSCRCVLKPVLQ